MPHPASFRRAALGIIVILGFLALSLGETARTRAQSPAAPARDAPLAFEVASIKVNHNAQNLFGIGFSRGRFTANGSSLKMLITLAYDVRPFQVSGGPNWINTDKYDIDAKLPDGLGEQMQNLPDDQRRAKYNSLVQSLLADRFQLKVSHTTKEGPVYNLVIAKNGPLIHQAKPGDDYANGVKGRDGNPVGHGNIMRMMPGKFVGQAVPLQFLVQQLSMQTGRKVIDQTGLKGNYDFDLTWSPELGPGGMMGGPAGGGPAGGGPPGAGPGPDAPPLPDASGPSIFTALQEQLGLKLDSAKGPVDILVIDHVEKPTED